MRQFFSPLVITGLLLLCLVSGAITFYFSSAKPEPEKVVEAVQVPKPVVREIGKSVQGRPITAYTYGTGATKLVFVGGIHGGYEWNSVVLAYQFKDYLDANPSAVSANESITVIPNANPDGVFKVVSKEGRFDVSDVPEGDVSEGRFNAHEVDLNRNFDCDWNATGTWQNKKVSGGTEPFSEPEAAAIRDFALKEHPAAFIFWHSAAGGVYSSECGKGILPETLTLMNTYAKASGYPAVEHFDAYIVHGASEDWLASIAIPAITVELSTHNDVEWEKNLAGAQAVIANFSR